MLDAFMTIINGGYWLVGYFACIDYHTFKVGIECRHSLSIQYGCILLTYLFC